MAHESRVVALTKNDRDSKIEQLLRTFVYDTGHSRDGAVVHSYRDGLHSMTDSELHDEYEDRFNDGLILFTFSP